MPRNEHKDLNNCSAEARQANVCIPAEDSASATAETGTEISGNPSHGNIAFVKENVKEHTLETEALEKMRPPPISPEQAIIGCFEVPPEPNASVRKSDGDVSNFEKKLTEAHAAGLSPPDRYEELDTNLNGSVDAYISQYQFESSIDETSLRSFLEISCSSLDRSRQSNVPKCLSQSEGDEDDNRATPRKIEGDARQLHRTRSDFDKDNLIAVKCGEESSAETSDTYHTALESVIHDEFSENFMTSVEGMPGRKNVGEAQADYFETNIREESLKSFLEMSRSSPEKSESCPSFFSATDGDTRDKGKTSGEIKYDKLQSHEQTGESGKSNTATLKQKSDRTARTSDFDHISRKSQIHEELTKESVDKQRAGKKTDVAKATSESQVISHKAPVYFISESAVIKRDECGTLGVSQNKQISKSEVEDQKPGPVTTRHLNKTPKEKKKSTSQVKKADRDQSSLMEVFDSSRKIKSQQSQKRSGLTSTSKNTTKAKSQSYTAVSTKDKGRKIDENSLRQKPNPSNRNGRSSWYLIESRSRSGKTDRCSKENNINSKTSTPTVPRRKSGLKRVSKERVRANIDQESSLAKNAAKRGKHGAGNDRTSGSSLLRRTKPVGNSKEEQRGVQKPKRRHEVNKPSIPRYKQHRSQKDRFLPGDGRRPTGGKRLMAPIAVFGRGLCFNENALIQLQEDIIWEVNDVVRALHYRVQKGYHQEKGKFGLKLIFFKDGK